MIGLEIIFNKAQKQRQQQFKSKILSIKRFGMDFQKYINHNTNRSANKPVSTKKGTQQKPRVIKFVGNMEENIKELLQGINCHCGNKKQFYNILVVFANKIQKLRTQRDHYKNTLKDYLLAMNTGSTTSRSYSAFKPKNINLKPSQETTLNKLQSVPSSTLSLSNNKQSHNPLTKVAKFFHKEQFKTLYTEQNEKKSTQPKIKTQLKQAEQSTRNNFTAIKKLQNQAAFQLKQLRAEDKRMSHFYQTEKKAFDQPCDEGSFSLNLSSFEDIENKQTQTSEFMKEVSSIMSETNLLDSDDQQQKTEFKKSLNESSPKLSEKVSQLQQKVNKLKMFKQSNNFEEILLSLNDQETQFQTKQSTHMVQTKKNMKKKENPEQVSRSHKKSDKKADKHHDKENMKGQSCLKKYNISLEKLEEFIENKECLKQLQKTQHFDINLKNFKSISSCTFKKDLSKEYESLKQANRGRALEERKFQFNI